MRERLRFESEIGLLLRNSDFMKPEREAPELETCRKNWEKFFATLPSDVQNALQTEDWNNAIILAIHHGIRDIATLTKMLFHAKYGKERGYCNIKNPVAEKKYVQFWGQVKSSIRGLMARPSPPLSQKGGVVCQKVERILSDPKPDNPKIDITGHYENQININGKIKTDWTIRINQAGRHIEGIITKVLYPDQRPKGWLFHEDDDEVSRPFTEFYGDLQADGSFLFFDRRDPSGNWGYFRPKGGKVQWELSGKGVSTLTKISENPTLMNTSSFDKLVWLHEKFPLTLAQMKNLVRGLSTDKVAAQLEKYFSTPAGIKYADKSAMASAAAKVGYYIADVFTNGFYGVNDEDLELAQFYAKTILTNNKWKFKQITRSQLDWIQIMLDVNSRNGFTLKPIEKYLGLKPSNNNADPTAPMHQYKVTLKLTGAAIIIGGYFGKITIEKLNGRKWKETFGVHFFGGGLDVSFRDEMVGRAETYHEWVEPDFPGTIRLGEIGISFGSSAAAGFMQIFGSGYLPPMDVGYTDVDLKLKPKAPKAGGKALPFGKIRSKTFKDFDATKSIAITDYAADYKLKNDTHFCLGSAVLTEDARQALRIVCANELIAFSTPSSSLEIIGHTDRVDTDERNLTLSALRASNTEQAIKDILGSNFKIPDSQIKVVGKGENEAKAAGRLDNKPEPKDRRVDVKLNSRLLISLKAL